jgi:hypothetical protein
MPIARRLDAETQVLHTTISGMVTLQEMREHFTAVRAMDGQKYPELIDTRGATGLDFSARDLPGLADLGRRLFADGGYTAPRAVIVTGVMYFGMARLFSSFAAPWVRIAVFDKAAAAEGWLDHVVRITQDSR